MAKPVSHATLQAVGKTPLLAHILEMAGDLDHVEIARFNRAFCSAVQKLQARVCSHLSLAQSVAVLGKDVQESPSCQADFEHAWKEMTDAAEKLHAQVALIGDLVNDNSRVTYERYWNRIVGLKKSVDEEAVFAVREKRMRGLLKHLPYVQTRIEALDHYYSDPLNMAINTYNSLFREEGGEEDPLPHLLKTMEQCIVSESATLRFRAIIADKRLNPETHPSASLAELHKKQKAEASSNAQRLLQFNEIAKSRTFSVPRFIEQEKVAFASEMARHADLYLLWEATLREFQQLGIVLGDAMPRTPEEIRSWFDRPENGAHLARVEKLTCLGLKEVPPQLEKFLNVKVLCLKGDEHGKISTLPAWLASLTHLHVLSLERNAFREIPALLRKPLQDGLWVDLNWNPISVFPDEVYRAYEVFGESRMKLTTFSLEEIPFRHWFKEHYTLPLPKVVYPTDHLVVPIPSPWYELLYVGLLCLNISLFLTPIIALFNIIQEHIVEPLFTFGRDLFGFSRMVKNKKE